MDLFSLAYDNGQEYTYRHVPCVRRPEIFFQQRLIKYLGGPIKRYKLPKSSDEKIELEPLNQLLFSPRKPILVYLPEEKITVQRIVGYRELYRKRERIYYLQLVEGKEPKQVKRDCKVDIERSFAFFPEAAPGGGKQKDKEAKQSESETNEAADKKAAKKELAGKKTGHKVNASKKHHKKEITGKKTHLKDHAAKIKAEDEKNDNKAPADEENKKSEGKKGGKAKGVEAKSGNTDLVTEAESEKTDKKKLKKDIVRFGADGKPLTKKELKRLKEKLDKKKKELEILKKEKDQEWLQLSDSDEERKQDEIDDLQKPLMPWMKKNLSHETQLLHYNLELYMIFSKLVGRQFWYVRPNLDSHLIEYNISRKKMFIFVCTTFLLWVFLCFAMHAIVDIKFSETKKKNYQVVHYGNIEEIEWSKYGAMMYLIVAQALIVGLWSVIVILSDGLKISNYLNCWNAALTEMETSGTSGIIGATVLNLGIFFVYAVTLTVCFAVDFPKTVRGSSGLLSMLVFRGVVAEIRTIPGDGFFNYQVIGHIFHLYVIYCIRNMSALLQIMALLLKNAAEMWNLKFGMTFSQFIFNDRAGNLMHVKLNHSLLKTFTHHRLLCGLVDQFGIVFAWPIAISVVIQMGIFTRGTVAIMRLKSLTKEDFDGKEVLEYNGVYVETFLKLKDNTVTEIFVLTLITMDFLLNTEAVSATCRSFTDGFEFVRRQGLIMCKTSHQRRLIQSLQWSMSAASAYLLTAGGLFSLTREMVFAAIANSFNFFSLIIQLTERKDLLVLMLTRKHCEGKTIDRDGFCVLSKESGFYRSAPRITTVYLTNRCWIILLQLILLSFNHNYCIPKVLQIPIAGKELILTEYTF